MDPRHDLLVAAGRRADFERQAAEHRLARSLRRPRKQPTITLHRRASTAGSPIACCPA